MARAQDHLFQIALAIAKGRLGLAAPFEDFILKLVRPVDRTHAAPAAAPRRLEHQGISNGCGLGADGIHILAQHFGRGDHRHTCGNRHAARRRFVAQGTHCRGFGANECDAFALARVDQFGVFGQKTIARVDRICAALFGDAHDFLNRQIGGHGAKTFANAIGFIRFEPVQAKLVLFGENGNGFFAHFIGRPHNTDCDFASIGNQDLGKFGHAPTSYGRFVP